MNAAPPGPVVAMLLVVVAVAAARATVSREPYTSVQTISLGTLTPSALGLPRSISVPFQLALPAGSHARGITASAVFMFVASAPADGGRTITAGDIGVGVTAVSSPERVTVAPGFAYDPAAIRGSRGANPYLGAVAGHATIEDLQAPQLILAAPPSVDRDSQITVTLTFGIVPRFFTPGTFTITVTLTSRDTAAVPPVR